LVIADTPEVTSVFSILSRLVERFGCGEVAATIDRTYGKKKADS
jgi:hypothetical protein